MKKTYLLAFTMAAALTAAPAFAQEPDKAPEAPKAHENAPADKDKDKAVKPEKGSVKTQEGGQEKSKTDTRHESKLPQSDQEPGVANPDHDKQQPDRDAAPKDRRENDNEAKRGVGGDRADHAKHADYHFKGDEKTKLRSSYHDINRVDRSRRVTIVREQVLPVEIRTRIEPVPVEVVSYLPPPPEGYSFGFVDGYCVVYDPTTFIVVDVIDLF